MHAKNDLHSNRYSHNDFVVSDNESVYLETDDEAGSDIGLVRGVRNPHKLRKQTLGPPIKIDEKIGSLNETHQTVLEEFMVHATELSTKVSQFDHLRVIYADNRQLIIEKGLHTQPFSDSILREMAINFPQS